MPRQSDEDRTFWFRLMALGAAVQGFALLCVTWLIQGPDGWSSYSPGYAVGLGLVLFSRGLWVRSRSVMIGYAIGNGLLCVLILRIVQAFDLAASLQLLLVCLAALSLVPAVVAVRFSRAAERVQ